MQSRVEIIEHGGFPEGEVGSVVAGQDEAAEGTPTRLGYRHDRLLVEEVDELWLLLPDHHLTVARSAYEKPRLLFGTSQTQQTGHWLTVQLVGEEFIVAHVPEANIAVRASAEKPVLLVFDCL